MTKIIRERSKKVKLFEQTFQKEKNMNNISDIIEDFIMDTIGQETTVNLSRNELAQYFNCAPSQINYVLNTRFTVQRGFFVESRRGGGGYIKVIKLEPSDNYFADLVSKQIGLEIDYNSAIQVLENLKENEFISDYDERILKSALSPKALSGPIKNDDYVRANILKNVIYEIQKGEK